MTAKEGRVSNRAAADRFRELALAREIQGEHWKAVSYLIAAEQLDEARQHIQAFSESGRLREIQGVGNSISSKLDEYLSTGRMQALEDVRAILPEDLALFRDLKPLGTALTARAINALRLSSADDLSRAVDQGALAEVDGLDASFQTRTAEFLARRREEAAEVPSWRARRSALNVVECLRRGGGVDRMSLGGPIMRNVDSVANVTILFSSPDPGAVIARFGLCSELIELLMVEPDRAIGRTRSGAAVMVRHVPADSFAVELVRGIGPDRYISQLTAAARNQGHRLSGQMGSSGIETDEDVHRALGLEYVPPEMRGRRPTGRIAARADELKGDMRVRSRSADGSDQISAMASAAARMGHEWICFCDRVGSKGLSVAELELRDAQIGEASDRHDVALLRGAVVDVLPDGRLDFPSSALDRLDLVIAVINSDLAMDAGEMTSRALSALDDPNADVFGHPTGRILGLREPYRIDLGRVAERARQRGAALEIDACPDVMDLDADQAEGVYEQEALYGAGTDAALPGELAFWDGALTTIRRASIPAGRLLNSRPARDMAGRRWRK